MEPTLHLQPTGVERGVERAVLAKVGAFLFSGALIFPAATSSVSAQASSVIVATALAVETPVLTDRRDATIALPELLPRTTLRAIAALSAFLEAPVLAVPPPEPLVTNGVVLASWYGPGFFGNQTACGQTFTAEILGVAHRTLPCGTGVQITSPAGVTVVVPVIDRGPFIAGRSLDLSVAVKTALRCSDLCHVRVVVLDK